MIDVDVPVLHISGWYDDVQRGTTVNFSRMTGDLVNEKVRASQWLLLGPWDHGLTMTRNRQLGPVDFGPGAEIDLRAFELEWLEHALAADPAASTSPRVRLFVMGENEWRDENEWPIARTRWTDYFLESGGSANSRHGDGRLSRDEQGEGTSPRTRSSTTRPTRCRSSATTPRRARSAARTTTPRSRSEPTCSSIRRSRSSEAREVTGPVRMVLHASSTARDTDFTAKLVDVYPDGFCQRLCDGLVRARFRNGFGVPEQFLEPGEVVEYEIDLWSTSHVFAPGHRIRLEVSSSAFPKYNRNLNTGGPIATDTEIVKATQEVWHDALRPSRLILPEIPS